MIVLSEKTKKAMFNNLVICFIASIIHFTLGKSWYTSAGAAWMLITSLDLLQRIIGYLLLPVITKPINVLSVKEVKHDEATSPLYQYIVKEKGKEWYTPIFSVPLRLVVVKAFSFGKYRFVKIRYKNRRETK